MFDVGAARGRGGETGLLTSQLGDRAREFKMASSFLDDLISNPSADADAVSALVGSLESQLSNSNVGASNNTQVGGLSFTASSSTSSVPPPLQPAIAPTAATTTATATFAGNGNSLHATTTCAPAAAVPVGSAPSTVASSISTIQLPNSTTVHSIVPNGNPSGNLPSHRSSLAWPSLMIIIMEFISVLSLLRPRQHSAVWCLSNCPAQWNCGPRRSGYNSAWFGFAPGTAEDDSNNSTSAASHNDHSGQSGPSNGQYSDWPTAATATTTTTTIQCAGDQWHSAQPITSVKAWQPSGPATTPTDSTADDGDQQCRNRNPSGWCASSEYERDEAARCAEHGGPEQSGQPSACTTCCFGASADGRCTAGTNGNNLTSLTSNVLHNAFNI